MVSTVHQFLDQAADHSPAKTAVISEEGRVTYRRLAENSRRFASWMSAAGIARGDRVAIMLPNGIPAITALMAVSRIGAIYFIVNPSTRQYHLHHILTDAAPRLIITAMDYADDGGLSSFGQVQPIDNHWLESLDTSDTPPPFPGIPGDPVSLIYTSGSTGMPKAVISSHRNVIFAAWAIQECLRMEPSDIVGNFLPLSFDYGLYQVFLTFQARATLALGSDSHVGPALLRKLNEWKISGLPLVPNLASTLIRLAKRSPNELPALRFITNTGAHLPRSYITEMQALFPAAKIFVMFGLTECKRVSILQPEEYAHKSESVGRPLPQTECLIVDPFGNVVSPGEVGELVVRGPNVMLGYWRSPELTAKRFRPWGAGLEVALFSGDMCRMDADGYLYFHGRTDDIFKQGGYRVSASEIEAAACDISGIGQAALLLPAGEHGSVLFVTGTLTSEEVIDELRRRLEDHKLPSEIRIIDEFPLTSNGKTDKKQLMSYIMEPVAS